MNKHAHSMPLDMPAILTLGAWAGRRRYRIRLTGEARENYRFEALEAIPMPRNRWLKTGDHGRAPKCAVSPPPHPKAATP